MAERGICSSCQRDIALDHDGNIWPHGGKPSSGFRCPGAGKPPQSNMLIDLIKPPAFKVGDRVVKGTMCGIVAEVAAGQVLVHYGTATAVEGRPGILMQNWEPEDELELYPEPVYVREPDGTRVTVWEGSDGN